MKPHEEDDPFSRRRFLTGAAGAGVAAAAASSTATAQEDEEEDGGDENDDGEDGGGETVEVSVIDNEFDPAQLSIEPGTTVRWVWEGQAQHNVEPSGQPDGADWEGHPDLKADGDYEYTFEVEGEYDYVCRPHVGLGMEGTITVGEGGGAGGPQDLVPDAAWTLLVGTVAGMVSVLSLAYAFMRYGGSSGPDR